MGKRDKDHEAGHVTRVQVLLVPLLVLASSNAWSDVASDTLQVSARALHARLDSQDTATTLRITAADLERGYVEVTRHYSLRTNAPDRVALQLHTRLDYARSIEVGGFGAVLRLLDDPIELAPPARDEFDLTFRVWPVAGRGLTMQCEASRDLSRFLCHLDPVPDGSCDTPHGRSAHAKSCPGRTAVSQSAL